MTHAAPSGGLSQAAQVAIPIAVALGVALFSILGAWWYFRRKPKYSAVWSSPAYSTSDEGIMAHPRMWLNRLKLMLSSHRVEGRSKSANWDMEGEDGAQLLQGRGRSSLHDPFNPTESQRALTLPTSNPSPPMQEAHNLGVLRPSSHSREWSSSSSGSSLLPRIELPEVRVPTFVERIVGLKGGGLKKSASYKAKSVAPRTPGPDFRIDGSGSSPIAQNPQAFNTIADFRRPQGALTPVFERETEADVPEAARPASGSDGSWVVVDRPLSQVTEPSRARSSEVILISRNGEDFSMHDTATTAPGSPKTPSTLLQVSATFCLLCYVPFQVPALLPCSRILVCSNFHSSRSVP